MTINFRLLAVAGVLASATSCKSFLDINNNPNQPTSQTANALLANALATTAATYTGQNPVFGNSYNDYYASFAADYLAKSGTVSGFSQERLYTYNNTYYQTLYNATYDNLNDYNLIQAQAAAYPNHAAIARIMKAYDFLLLVDQYGDVPYSQALQGLSNVAPKYDKAQDIYTDLIAQLKGAIKDIDAAADAGTPVGAEDVVFGGGATGMTRWKRFANSLRLRILLRESSAVDVKAEMALVQAEPDGFITSDVVVQPGYATNSGQQNPFYNRYGIAVGLTVATAEYSYQVPTKFIIRQYVNNADPRITQLYRLGLLTTVTGADTVVTTPYVGADAGINPPLFDPATGNVTSRLLRGGAFLRGASQPVVLMLLAEHLFSKAEAETKGLLTGDAKTDYLNGIEASFIQTYRTATDLGTINGTTVASATTNTPGVTQYNTYIAANVGNGLVDYDAAATTVIVNKKDTGASRAVSAMDKILYQKYLAENIIASVEALDDYRRTGQPNFEHATTGQKGGQLPNRLIYPQTEVSTNAANIPAVADQYVPIFWQLKTPLL